MELTQLNQLSDYEWEIPATGKMNVPAIIFATEQLMRDMDQKVFEQITNVARLPGIIQAAYAMPDAHWGYGFPIGGVAAFDAQQAGVVSAGGVGFDISCGVRLIKTGLTREAIDKHQRELADQLFAHIPAGLGSKSAIVLSANEMDDMLSGGARWAVSQGYGLKEDLNYIEEQGCMAGAVPENVPIKAKERQKREMGTLGSGNHYLEVQEVNTLYDKKIAAAFGLQQGDIVISIHCGSRGLGHQIGTEYLKLMVKEAPKYGIELPDRELACAPLLSSVGQDYLGAMRAGINCALANRQIIMHFVREVFADIFPKADLSLLYDVSHNTCKEEQHSINGKKQTLFVHRKGATRAFGPHHPNLPDTYKFVGQPVIIGGSMGTHSYVLAGAESAEQQSFSSACHGAGRAMSRHQALKQWHGRELIQRLEEQGILIRSVSHRGVAEEAPGAYKDVTAVVDAAHLAGLATKVAKLSPLICVKG